MIDIAEAKWGFDPAQSFVIGDAACDIGLAKSIGAVSIRIRSDTAVPWPAHLQADETANDLIEAATAIERRLGAVALGPPPSCQRQGWPR
jgi:histidinol phosphatase-like enzyme